MFFIVPVLNGEPDFDWGSPPLESFQLNDTQRYCKFLDDVEIRSSWTAITEEEFEAARPAVVEVVPPYIPTNAELSHLISDLQADLIIAGVI